MLQISLKKRKRKAVHELWSSSSGVEVGAPGCVGGVNSYKHLQSGTWVKPGRKALWSLSQAAGPRRTVSVTTEVGEAADGGASPMKAGRETEKMIHVGSMEDAIFHLIHLP